jgi:NADH:ubiquinone reductase (H+-translocating)
VPKYPRVVVVGAGFGGMQAAQSLASLGVDVLLIDRQNYHTFVPLLYQVATAQLEPEQVVYPIRNLVRRSPRHLRFLLANVERIDFVCKQVETDAAVIPYDVLVLATGSQTQYLGIPGAAEHALPLRTLADAVALRDRLLSRFEQAAHTDDPEWRQALLTFAIVGGGATGVEMAGALTELVRQSLVRDYPQLDLRQVQIILLQAGDRLLPDLPASLGDYTYRRLRQIGVEVYLQAKVSQVSDRAVTLETGQVMPTATVIWTAGLEAALPPSNDLTTAAKGKLRVCPTLQLLHDPTVYAIGDLAYVEQNGKSLDGVAPEALQQGVAVARNIARQRRGKEPQPFSYFNKGRLAIIGCYAGVGKIGRFAFTGWLAWLMWLGVHLVYLPGFRNRLMVLFTWLYSYPRSDRSIRIISSPSVARNSTSSPSVASSKYR